MAELTRQDVSQAGLDPSFQAAEASGDSYVADDRTFLAIKNSDGAATHDVTIQVQRTSFDIPGYGEVTFADLVITVPISGQMLIKAPQAPYADGNGKVQVTYGGAESDFTVAAVRMPAG